MCRGEKRKKKRLGKETIPERGKVNIPVLVSSLKGGHYLYFDHTAWQRTSNGYYDFVSIEFSSNAMR